MLAGSQSIALDRFGLGACPGDRVGRDPREWVVSQLTRYDPAPPALAGQPGTEQLVALFRDYREQAATARRERKAMAQADGERPGDPFQRMPRRLRKGLRESYTGAADARLASALATDAPFPERLVHFWSNHFALSVDKVAVLPLAGNHEFAAIRPHVMGSFRNLLRAAVLHPGMLLYLDQAQSVGLQSLLAQRAGRFAQRKGKAPGLNENLGREIMELHTLGVRTGYSQTDVTEFARALTGWTVAGFGRGRLARVIDGPDGKAFFAPALHEPGARNVMGNHYAEDGESQALAILDDLARHPATAHHIASKLASHFIADDPPPAAVARLEKAFLTSDGDLPTVYRALVDEPEAWDPAAGKFRTPWDWTVASLRALRTGRAPAQPGAASLLQQFGQPVWRPGSPAGWGDTAADWAGPGALMTRVEVAQQIAARTGDRIDARQLLPSILPEAGSNTKQAIARSESPALGLALMLSSPEFLRR